MLCVLKIRELFICVVLLGSLAWDSEEECVWSVTLLDSISQMVKQSKHTEGQGILRPRPHGAMRTDTRPWCMTGEPTFFCVELRSQGTAHALFNPSLLDFASQPCILIGIFSLCDIIILLSKEESYWKKFPGAPALGLWHVGWWKNRYLSLFSMWDLLLVQAVREAPSGSQADSDCCEITRQMSQSQHGLPSREAAWPIICRDRLDFGASGQYTSPSSSWTGSSRLS